MGERMHGGGGGFKIIWGELWYSTKKNHINPFKYPGVLHFEKKKRPYLAKSFR